MRIKKYTIICALLCMCIAATVVLAGCGSTSTNTASEATTAATVDSAKTDGIDYMALVNKTHKLPDDWEEHLETVHMTNSVGDDVEVTPLVGALEQKRFRSAAYHERVHRRVRR